MYLQTRAKLYALSHFLAWGWGDIRIGEFTTHVKTIMQLSAVPEHPTYLYSSRAKAYCACGRCEWDLFLDIFFSNLSFLMSFSLSGKRPDVD